MQLPARIFFAATIAAASIPAFSQGMEPGEWQMTTSMSSPMFPKPQSVTQTQCIRKGEGDDPNRLMGEQPSGCKVTVKQKSADGYAWEMSCPKEGMRGSGSVRFTRDSMQGEVRMSGESGGQKFDMLTKMSGKRTGPCK